ncbi:MAG: acyltransferase [Nitrospirales bacterium]|nr:acyltransferase [Nitrospirales bacterium]
MKTVELVMGLFNSIVSRVRVKIDPVGYARALGVSVGEGVRLVSIRPGNGTFGSEPYLIQIGSHVTVSGGVQFVTHDGGVWVFRNKEPDIDVFGKIVIGDNVFLGYGVVIMPNVLIGSNVVIGAGAVVTKDIPPNCVAAGVPAKVIKSLDDYYKKIKEIGVKNIRSLGFTEKRKILVQIMNDR